MDGNGNITFTDPKKNGVFIAQATGNVQRNLLDGQEPGTEEEDQIRKLTVSDGALQTRQLSKIDYLTEKGAELEITVDGVTKTIQVPGENEIGKDLWGNERDAAFVKALQKNVDDAFGKGKLTVSDKNGDVPGVQIQFDAPKGSTFSVTSTKGKLLGFGESGKVTSYLNTSKTLGELLGDKGFEGLEPIMIPLKDSNGNVIPGAYEGDENGNPLYETDANGNTLYSFKVNGKEVGKFSKDTTLSTVFNAMNSSSDSGVKVGYSKLTNELTFTAKDTGADSEIRFEGLSAKLFGAPGTYDDDKRGTYSKGQDAIFEATVNGTSLGEITRSSNSVEMDGMTVNLKGTFGYETNEDGSVKYAQQTDKNGNLVFSYNNGSEDKEIYGKKQDDGTFQAVGKTGNPYKFSSSKAEYADFVGKDIFMETGADGNPSFFVKNGDEKLQLYARLDSKQNLWFSPQKGAEDSMNATVRAVQDKTSAVKTNTEGVTFETSSDADKIVDAVKQMVEDYNAMAKEIKDAYSTLPAQRSNKQYYEPLTAEEEEGQTESFIKNWNEKAKQGILFGDRDLASLYQRMTSAISMTGENGAALREAGITVNYSDGMSTLEFNETKFRAALNNDPDKVRDAFTASVESGAKSNGLMQALKQPLEAFGKTEGGKGALVQKAGSPLAPSTMYNNTIQKELNRIDEEIEKWQEKMEDQIDSYTSQFSRLEQLVQQMNSQSSYFSQLMGG